MIGMILNNSDLVHSGFQQPAVIIYDIHVYVNKCYFRIWQPYKPFIYIFIAFFHSFGKPGYTGNLGNFIDVHWSEKNYRALYLLTALGTNCINVADGY